MSLHKKHIILSPGRLIDESDPQELKDALFCPKVGGRAIFPRTCGIEDGHVICSICSQCMSLVASVRYFCHTWYCVNDSLECSLVCRLQPWV